MQKSLYAAFGGMCAFMLLAFPASVFGYVQASYYAQSYYQPYYQTYYQPYYQTYYQSSYSVNVGPLFQNTTYTAMCPVVPSGTVSDSKTISVQPVPCQLGTGTAGTACSSTNQCVIRSVAGEVPVGQTTSLSWCCPAGAAPTISNAGAYSTAVNTGGALTGSAQVGPGSYTLTCATGSGTQNINTVTQGSVMSFAALPSRVRRGAQTSLSWSTSYMQSCTVRDEANNTLSTALNSTGLNVTINQAKTFTLSCTDIFGASYAVTARATLLPSFQEI